MTGAGNSWGIMCKDVRHIAGFANGGYFHFLFGYLRRDQGKKKYNFALTIRFKLMANQSFI